MTKEEKDLLLRDLCARLPYKVILVAPNGKTTYQTDGNTGAELLVEEGFKPYLRPMSSMTEEEKKGLKKLFDAKEVTSDSICFLEGGTLEEYVSYIEYSFCAELIDWLNKKMFDYRELIPMNLALEATEGMYLY